MYFALLLTLAVAPFQVPNAGFEQVAEERTFPDNWAVHIGGDAKATVVTDDEIAHSGARCVRISNESPQEAFVYATFASSRIPVRPETTYMAHFHARGRSTRNCYIGVAFTGGGDHRMYLPDGDYDWQRFSCLFTTPVSCEALSIRFASDDVTESLWIDDVSLDVSPQQLANMAERRYPKDFPGVFPRPGKSVAEQLLVLDCNALSSDMELLVTTFQGLINREQPRLYLINRTNPPGYDEDWLDYMQKKGYTDEEARITDPQALFKRFRSLVTGLIITDPELPGSVNAACMLASVKDALPASPELAETLDLPVVMDLRGKWTRNVDAYRYVYENHWDDMNHHVLAWMYPLAVHRSVRDYLAQFKIFTFWLSSNRENEVGADPAAEELFAHELLANTPANIPVMGWSAYADVKGIPEYSWVRWLSEYGKFVPGTEFCSNLSVHAAIRPDADVFKQKFRSQPRDIKLEDDNVYISINVLDSGDSLWYWQFHQKKIWSDPTRGNVPVGWCMNITLPETLPLVAQWYYENATAQDSFFAGVSGLGYMNTHAFASRFRSEDRARIWKEYVALTDTYCKKLDIDGIELYNGSWGEPTPPEPDTFQRFADGMDNLDYIIADLGHHTCIAPDKANYAVGDTAVFHTLTRFRVWATSDEVTRQEMGPSNEWLLNEIVTNAPTQRPGFMSTMAISWYYYPEWFQDLHKRLPPHYIPVSPHNLARLWREK